MSTDYDLHCNQCGVSCKTVASGSIAYGDKLWRGDTELDTLRDFLFAHCGHPLIFDDSQKLDDGEDDPE